MCCVLVSLGLWLLSSRPKEEWDEDGKGSGANDDEVSTKVGLSTDGSADLAIEPEELGRKSDLLLAFGHVAELRGSHSEVASNKWGGFKDVCSFVSGSKIIPADITSVLWELPLLTWNSGILNVEVGHWGVSEVVNGVDNMKWFTDFTAFFDHLLIEEDEWSCVHCAEKQNCKHTSLWPALSDGCIAAVVLKKTICVN